MKLLLLPLLFTASYLLAFDKLEMGIPSQADTIIDREGYALGYSETHEKPESGSETTGNTNSGGRAATP